MQFIFQDIFSKFNIQCIQYWLEGFSLGNKYVIIQRFITLYHASKIAFFEYLKNGLINVKYKKTDCPNMVLNQYDNVSIYSKASMCPGKGKHNAFFMRGLCIYTYYMNICK